MMDRNSGGNGWVESALATQALWMETPQPVKPAGSSQPAVTLPKAARGLMATIRQADLVLTQALWNK